MPPIGDAMDQEVEVQVLEDFLSSGLLCQVIFPVIVRRQEIFLEACLPM